MEGADKKGPGPLATQESISGWAQGEEPGSDLPGPPSMPPAQPMVEETSGAADEAAGEAQAPGEPDMGHQLGAEETRSPREPLTVEASRLTDITVEGDEHMDPATREGLMALVSDEPPRLPPSRANSQKEGQRQLQRASSSGRQLLHSGSMARQSRNGRGPSDFGQGGIDQGPLDLEMRGNRMEEPRQRRPSSAQGAQQPAAGDGPSTSGPTDPEGRSASAGRPAGTPDSSVPMELLMAPAPPATASSSSRPVSAASLGAIIGGMARLQPPSGLSAQTGPGYADGSPKTAPASFRPMPAAVGMPRSLGAPTSSSRLASTTLPFAERLASGAAASSRASPGVSQSGGRASGSQMSPPTPTDQAHGPLKGSASKLLRQREHQWEQQREQREQQQHAQMLHQQQWHWPEGAAGPAGVPLLAPSTSLGTSELTDSRPVSSAAAAMLQGLGGSELMHATWASGPDAASWAQMAMPHSPQQDLIPPSRAKSGRAPARGASQRQQQQQQGGPPQQQQQHGESQAAESRSIGSAGPELMLTVQSFKLTGSPGTAPATVLQQDARKRRAGPARLHLRAPLALPPVMHDDFIDGNKKQREGVVRRLQAQQMQALGAPPVVRKFVPRPPTPDGAKLDGFMLLVAGDEEFPEHVLAARLPGRNISDVEAADMAYFSALRGLDLGDNRVPDMACLAGLPALRSLSLASNRLGALGSGFPPDAFACLEVLDLSYNRLPAELLLGVGSPLEALPRLRELDASGNRLAGLPRQLGCFEALQALRLCHNKLQGGALQPLAALPSLVYLNLAHNAVAEVPAHLAGPGGRLGQAREPFPCLAVLDLTHNRVGSEAAIARVRGLPCLEQLLLDGNPLAVAHAAAAKRLAAKRATLLAGGAGAVVTEEERALLLAVRGVNGAGQPLRVAYEGVPALSPRKTVAETLSRRLVRIAGPVDPVAAGKAAALAAVAAAATEEGVQEVFERADQAIDAWQLNTVDEEGEGYEDDDNDTAPVEDNTFLTGVGISEKVARPAREAPEPPEPEPAPAPAPARPLWEDVVDPTERLALALGLDPRRLAVHTGQLTTDAQGSANALRFALSHPLVDEDEGMAPPQHHLTSTATARAKQRQKVPVRLAPLAPAEHRMPQLSPLELPPPPPEPGTVRLHALEGMLQGMKDRLKTLEGALTDKLAHLPPPPPVSEGRAKDVRDEEEEDEDGEEFEFGGMRRDNFADDRSDASPLPDEVIDLIENPDLSDSEAEEGAPQPAALEEGEAPAGAAAAARRASEVQGEQPREAGAGIAARAAGFGLTASASMKRIPSSVSG